MLRKLFRRIVRGSAADNMEILPKYFPSELHYIIPLAQEHGYEARVIDFDKRLGRHVSHGEKLKDEEIEPLRHLYLEIAAKDHSTLISTWIHTHGRNHSTCPPATTFPIFGLFCLFEQLGKRGVAPFNDGTVQYQEEKHALDWSKLPPSLQYLTMPAEKYGDLQFESRIREFLLEKMTATERAELQSLRPKYYQDCDEINRWLDEFPMTDHREAALVYFLGHVFGRGEDLDLLGDTWP